MFDHTHYVPVLRSKHAEWKALKQLKNSVRKGITPLITVVPEALDLAPQTPTLLQAFQKLATNIQHSWSQQSIFVDLELVNAKKYAVNGKHPVTALWQLSNTLIPDEFPTLIPVTSLRASKEDIAAVKAVLKNEALCLRLTTTDIAHPNLKTDIQQLLSLLGLGTEHVHLIVDLKFIGSDFSLSYAAILQQIPYVLDWQTLTITAGTFPENLGEFEVHTESLLARKEWEIWHEQVVMLDQLVRRPSFGDYACVHPVYTPPSENLPSASIRYTAPTYYIIMRGEKPKPTNEGAQQYPAHASSLCSREEFCGSEFSDGDKYFAQKAEMFVETSGEVPKPGGHKDWLAASINHHLTLTSYQIANQVEPSTAGAL